MCCGSSTRSRFPRGTASTAIPRDRAIPRRSTPAPATTSTGRASAAATRPSTTSPSPTTATGRATNVFINRGAIPSAKWWPGIRVKNNEADIFPPPYRGWGYAGYNADGQRGIQPINEADLVIRSDDLPDPDDPPSDDPDYKNPVKGDALPFGPLPANGLWIGPKFDDSDPDADPLDQQPCAWPFTDCLAPRGIWGGPDQASASMLGGDVLGALNPNQIITGDASAPALYAMTERGQLRLRRRPDSAAGTSTGKSESIVDFLDLNGDGYPDVVSRHAVVYTNENGGFGETVDPGLDGVVRTNHEFADQAGGGGSPASISTGSDGKGDGAGGASDGKGKKRKASKVMSNLSGSIGISGTLAHQSTNSLTDPQPDCDIFGDDCDTQVDLADLNGDGLPDRVHVTRDGKIFVRWNLGYRFTDDEALFAQASPRRRVQHLDLPGHRPRVRQRADGLQRRCLAVQQTTSAPR